MISLQKLYKRDKGICHICLKRVERLSDATREHRMPKIFGGRNDDSNISLAHKWCNEEKGKRIFRVEQHKNGWTIIDPNGNKSETLYTSEIEAWIIVSKLNEDKVYMDERFK